MPHISRPRFKVAKRRYSQTKNTPLSNDQLLPEAGFLKTEEMFRQMFERNRAVKLIIDPVNLQVIEANQSACDFYGYTSEQIKSLHLTDISTLAQPELMASVGRTVAAKGSTFQTSHRLASGEIRDVELFTGLLELGDKLYLYEIIQDITQRKQAERALRESEELYRRFAKHMPNTSVIMFDLNMCYILAEGPYLQRSQPFYKNMVGKLPQEVLPAESLEFLLPIYRRALQGESFSYERETEYYAYQAYVTPVFNDDGEIIGGMILSHDITERKKLENALQASEDRLRLIIDNIQDLVTYDDVKGNLVYVSPSSRTMLGYEPENLLDASSIELFHPMDRVSMTQTLGTAIATREPQFTVEGRIRHADGHYIDIETVGKLITNGGTSFIGGVFITRDVTQRKSLEELRIEKEKLQMDLQKEQEFSIYKTRLMRRINHGFRTPLTLIQASVETLGFYWDRITPEHRTEKKIQIEAQIKLLTNMLDEIALVISNSFKPEQLRRVPTHIGALCSVVALKLEQEFGLPGKYDIDLSEVIFANVDPDVIEKALMHILRNAAQYSEPSAVVSVSLITVKQGVEIRVEDTGKGILPNELRRIFEPFFRGNNVDEVNGLGIGLSLSQAALEAHGGRVTVVSSHGNGTTVTIWIPK